MPELTSKQLSWRIARSAVATGSADSDLTATTKTWASLLTNYLPEAGDGMTRLSTHTNKPEIRFRFTDTNGVDTATYKMYAIRENGDAKFVATGLATAGTQKATDLISGAASYYADTITITLQKWHTDVKSSNEDSGAADNEQAGLMFDAQGYKYLLILLTAVSAGSAAVDVSGV